VFQVNSLAGRLEACYRDILTSWQHCTHRSVVLQAVPGNNKKAGKGNTKNPWFLTHCILKTQIDDNPDEIRKELELELIQIQMTQKPMLRAEVGMRVRCANKASAE